MVTLAILKSYHGNGKVITNESILQSIVTNLNIDMNISTIWDVVWLITE